MEIFHSYNKDIAYVNVKHNTFRSDKVYPFVKTWNDLTDRFLQFHKEKAITLLENKLKELKNTEVKQKNERRRRD